MYTYVDYIILGLIVWIILFFICRELFCWYFKINKIVLLLEAINKKLGKDEDERLDVVENKKWTCSKCGTENDLIWLYCSKCGKQKKTS